MPIFQKSRADSQIFEALFDWGKENPLMIIQASVNGSPPAPFVFDTGSEATLILNESFTKIRTQATGRSAILNGVSRMQQVKPLDMAIKAAPSDLKIKIGIAYRTRLEPLDEFYGKGKIAGIIGGDLPHFFKISMDFDTRKIKFGVDTSKEDMGLSGWERARKLSLERDASSKICPVVRMLPQSEGAYFGIIDTGANISMFSEDLLKKYSTRKSRIVTTGADVLRVFEEQLYRVADFALSGEKQVIVARSVSTPKNFIGLDYLSRFNLYIDYANQEMLLMPRKTPVQLRGYRGFSLEKIGVKVQVDAVHPDFSGSEPLRSGDELILPGNKTLLQLEYLLDGVEGEERELKVRRNASVRTIRYRPISFF